MKLYKTEINSADSFGCVFCGVCKGKLSEGIDFIDNEARCVILIGIPY